MSEKMALEAGADTMLFLAQHVLTDETASRANEVGALINRASADRLFA